MSNAETSDALSIGTATRIRELLDERSMTPQDLSYETRINAGVISRWLRGAVMPNARSIITICTYFGVSSDWLLGLSTERHHGRLVSRTAAEIVDMTDQLEANERQRQASRNRRQS